MNYILGDTGFCYQVGNGVSYPLQPHHRSASCEDIPAPCDWDDFNKAEPNGQVLQGAVVGGPDINDNYNDYRGDFVQNEVATDYNAGFQSTIAFLAQKYAL